MGEVARCAVPMHHGVVAACHDLAMLSDGATKVLAHIDEVGLTPPDEGRRGWTHMGAVIVDAALQAGLSYKSVVLPRVRELRRRWPDAETTSRFLAHIEGDALAQVLRWDPASKKLATATDLAALLARESVETVQDLHDAVTDVAFRRRLRSVKGVGPKTVDYLAILAGAVDQAAVDVHLRRFVHEAGAEASTYAEVQDVIAEVAAERGWTVGVLDAAIWQYRSSRRRLRA